MNIRLSITSKVMLLIRHSNFACCDLNKPLYVRDENQSQNGDGAITKILLSFANICFEMPISLCWKLFKILNFPMINVLHPFGSFNGDATLRCRKRQASESEASLWIFSDSSNRPPYGGDFASFSDILTFRLLSPFETNARLTLVLSSSISRQPHARCQLSSVNNVSSLIAGDDVSLCLLEEPIATANALQRRITETYGIGPTLQKKPSYWPLCCCCFNRTDLVVAQPFIEELYTEYSNFQVRMRENQSSSIEIDTSLRWQQMQAWHCLLWMVLTLLGK